MKLQEKWKVVCGHNLKIVSFNVAKFYVMPKRVDPAESNLLQTKQAELRACICEIFQFPP